MPAKVHVSIGQPIDLSAYYDRPTDKELLGELTKRILQAIARLAGDNQFQPQLAGKNWHPDDPAMTASAEVAEARENLDGKASQP